MCQLDHNTTRLREEKTSFPTQSPADESEGKEVQWPMTFCMARVSGVFTLSTGATACRDGLVEENLRIHHSCRAIELMTRAAVFVEGSWFPAW